MSIFMKVSISVTTVLVLLLIVLLALFVPRRSKVEEIIWEGEKSFNVDIIKTVEKKKGEDFKILQLTDIQITTIFDNFNFVKKTVKKLVNEVKPNLIVLTGDNVAGLTSHINIDKIIKLMDSFEIPWAPVFGNHDRELNADLYYQSKKYQKSEYCLFTQGPSNIHGVGNYVVNVVEDNVPVYSLFLIDSNGYNKELVVDGEKKGGYEVIDKDQINWYQDNINGMEKKFGKVIPSMTFFHIALPEFKTAYFLAKNNSNDAKLLYGNRLEEECPSPINSGFFDVMLKLKSTTNVLVGHDHVNDYAVTYKGITLSYGVKTGSLSYSNKNLNGGTQITIDSSNDVSLKNIYYPR